MRKVLAAAIVSGLAFQAAGAAAYDDFVKAGEYMRIGNTDAALAAYSTALSAGDLAPAYVPDALLARAQIYLRRNECATALTDLDAALKLRPALIEALSARATASDCLGHLDAARADMDAMIAAAPSVQLYSRRGSFNWLHGDFAKAAADYAKAVSLHNPRSFDWRPGSYALVWYALSASRAQSFVAADFAAMTKGFDFDPWPGPVVSFILGKAKEDKVYKAAGEGEKDQPKYQKCEADFFLGEWRIGAGDTAGGKALLETVVKECPRANITYSARADLRRIP